MENKYPMASIPDRMEQAVRHFVEGHEDDRIVGLVTARYFETIARQIKRFRELDAICVEFKTSSNLVRPLHEVQFDFMDQIENFNMQTYVAISALSLLLRRGANASIRAQVPTDSMRKFLAWLKEKTNSSVLKDHLDCLEKSRDFRARLVEHPQNHALHDWITHLAHDHDPVIIYYDPKGQEVIARGKPGIDPYSADFEPPVNYKTFYIPPDFRKIQKAIFQGFPFILEQFTATKQ